MSDLTEFLLARLDEDEAAAIASQSGAWTTGGLRMISQPGAEGWEPAARGWVLVEPRHVLADVQAKRLTIEDFEVYARDARDDPSSEFARGRRHAALLAVTRVAAAYADHPDYRDEWRP